MRRTFRQAAYDAAMLLWKDLKDVKWAVIVITAYFVLGKYFLYSLCPMVSITGLPCPGCGLTRAGFLLFRGEFAEAFHMHPFIYVIVLYIALFGINRYIRMRETGIRLKLLLAVILALMVIFYMWRMMRCFPGEPPMCYYRRNLLWFVRNR